MSGENSLIEKMPIDPCGRCGCMGKYHNPDKGYTSSKFRIGLTRTYRSIIARTCCDSCPHCICFCVAFVEPFEGQKRTHCYYETANHDHNYHPELDSSFDYSVSCHMPQVQSEIPKPRRDEEVSSVRPALHNKKGAGKKLRNTIKPKSSKGGGLF